MNVAAAAIRHSRAVILIAIALVIAGALAAFSLPSSIYPPLEFPRIVTIVKSGTLPPQSMMLTVTRPLEQAALEVPGIRRVRSRSIRGATEISAQFAPSTDMVLALQMLQNRVAEARGELPADTELTVDDIADSLGFSEAAIFRRAFRRWTNRSPREFRDREHSVRNGPAFGRSEPSFQS